MRTAHFHDYDEDGKYGGAPQGVRISGPGASVAQDLEPEYIAVSDDSKTAWVTLQENNALAIIDIKKGRVKDLVALGSKDHSVPGYGRDASNEDGAIKIQPWPVLGTYMPDAIAAYKVKGRQFAFVGLERIGGVMIFDVTDPGEPRYVSYTNNRNFEEEADSV